MGRTRGQRIEELRGGAGETDRHWNRQMEPGLLCKALSSLRPYGHKRTRAGGASSAMGFLS